MAKEKVKYPLVKGYAEIAGVDLQSIADYLGLSMKSLYNRLSGRVDWSLDECRSVQQLLGNNKSLDEIFLPSDVAQTPQKAMS